MSSDKLMDLSKLGFPIPGLGIPDLFTLLVNPGIGKVNPRIGKVNPEIVNYMKNTLY